ncbi:2'-5' RNA ligase [Paenibacillus sp. J31TS4]|uniref:2'-5' RNA ligase family protein n=1 Tax=Paenibacillus sp. J31TS4 TaxID=2807195 RepID=UPI001B0651DB|nr:2'-5' RNA ligase family protein [Paenibacillus sp. J31TS4]GIP39449.1 2'-5' RNA ligase [Paenibacillus sp. J31TS4]
MGIAIELFLENRAEEELREIGSRLAAAGLGEDLFAQGTRPHLSLAVYDGEVDLDRLESTLQAFAAETPALRVTMASLGCFRTEEGVVYAAPDVTEALVEAHGAYHALAAEFAPVLRSYYRPGAWAPHCTLAMGLTAEQTDEALVRLAEWYRPGEVQVETAAIVRFRPHPIRTLAQFPMGGGGPPA